MSEEVAIIIFVVGMLVGSLLGWFIGYDDGHDRGFDTGFLFGKAYVLRRINAEMRKGGDAECHNCGARVVEADE